MIKFDRLISLVKDFNSRGESLALTKYTRLLRCCKVIVSDNIEKVNKILKRKKILLNDYDVLSLNKSTRLTIFCSFQNSMYAYKTISKRLLFFKDDCDAYVPQECNRDILMDIKSETTILLDRVVEQMMATSHKMILMTDKYSFAKRSCCYIDDSLDKDYLFERADIEDKLQELSDTIAKTCNNCSSISSDNENKSDNDHNSDNEHKSDDSTGCKTTGMDGNPPANSGRDALDGFKILPNKHVDIGKDINDENSFDCD